MTSEIEIWKWVPGYEGLYKISSCGAVKSMSYHQTGKERVLANWEDTGGYRQVKLWKDGKKRTLLVHRLVAEAFIPNPQNLPHVNHRDENPSNNRVENLEWCSPEYNCNYGTAIQRRVEKQSKRVVQFTKNMDYITWYKSLADVHRIKGYDQGSISHCCNGKTKSAYGFVWRYED